MSDPYHKVSTTFYDYFVYTTTGLTGADFTIQVDRNGVAGSTTGITIAEIGSTKSYGITVNSATGFVGAVGTYNLQIYRTVTPTDLWFNVVRVTADGTGAGSTGLTGFTSTSGDGRVVDSGTTPLVNAKVIITRPSGGGLYTSALTNSAGNWGPVYFDVDGVWSFTVQLAGYSVGSGTINVSSGIPTGPGVDITLSAVSSASSLTLSYLAAYARQQFRDRTGSSTDTKLTQSVNDALMMLASEHEWPWYQTVGRFNILSAYTTGTVAITNGSTAVALTGGTFPANVVASVGPVELYINNMYHRLSAVTSTTATLVNAWQETSYSGVYVLAQIEYALPTDCRQVSKVTATNQWIWGPNPTSRFNLEEARAAWMASATSPPNMWAIERDRIVIWPPSSENKMANLLYLRKPAELVGPTDVADWDSNLRELLFRAIDYQVACRGDCVAGDKGETYKSYRESLSRCVNQDRTATTRRVGLRVGMVDELRYPGNTITG